MRPTNETPDPADELQDARRGAWIEDLPLSDPIFDNLFPTRKNARPGEPPADATK